MESFPKCDGDRPPLSSDIARLIMRTSTKSERLRLCSDLVPTPEVPLRCTAHHGLKDNNRMLQDRVY